MRPLSRLGLRACLRVHLLSEVDQATGSDKEAIQLILGDRTAMTKLMDKVHQNLITDSTPLPPAPNQPVTPTDPVKHPFLKFLYDHREEILSFVLEVVKAMKGIFGK